VVIGVNIGLHGVASNQTGAAAPGEQNWYWAASYSRYTGFASVAAPQFCPVQHGCGQWGASPI
jgi:hypothetical protein